jgi:hypothetical protein
VSSHCGDGTSARNAMSSPLVAKATEREQPEGRVARNMPKNYAINLIE